MRGYFKKTYPNKGRSELPEGTKLRGLSPEKALEFWREIPSLRTYDGLYKAAGPETQLALDLLAEPQQVRWEKMPELYTGGYYTGRLQPHYRLTPHLVERIVSAVERIREVLQARIRAGTRLGIVLPTLEDIDRIRLVNAYYHYIRSDPPPRRDEYQDHSGSRTARAH